MLVTMLIVFSFPEREAFIIVELFCMSGSYTEMCVTWWVYIYSGTVGIITCAGGIICLIYMYHYWGLEVSHGHGIYIYSKKAKLWKVVRPLKAWAKKFGGGQEMAAMMLMLQLFSLRFIRFSERKMYVSGNFEGGFHWLNNLHSNVCWLSKLVFQQKIIKK